MNKLRSAVRPIATLMLLSVFCFLTAIGKVDPTILVGMLGPILGFWFRDRIKNSGGDTDVRN